MITIANHTCYQVSQKLVRTVLNKSCRALKIKATELSVAFVTSAEISKLNQTYRRQARPTDVLSFAYGYDRKELNGEIIICYQLARQNAREYHHSVKQEISRLLIHSLLHLIGYDHRKAGAAKKMEALENKIINL
ncbi:rRNA maturation RNase YbeY [Candidatus Kuenenbacteria bacterium CG_4_9_14_3_um_filter_39_14]|uniref:Endoribonuclease YbeY n=6 Tax=Candidatus Kueneniibacteriota TaxID=1752740 RepID=A0A2M7ILD1_9BACT|nr:rRNA maturation RNase YbeY [Candidatus Kuenenbacteria bacterium]PIP28925.1 MAG: rRNA maturation RNase YbeY [Candidatus Kuenenbacteria bacterium CG23_combo_of_CG06-09_8_20_14_all_39_39]PIP75746.1 MAG: rRNA maturation RNase YbeY [Candidatus Kuenenbacteria bacterium CG22_combo_CG10-13_8_21_14_all_39_9]PIR81072.1 MAG: rRNA maturation RNase YbeY [Candidatus Kuenenbacteria bacterium CG10_big_fil_rev_8_21_14_0_10_39_14]PIW95590.1 MAG: rRNA maturation RNase YbeY [Candidatus Kuenenbacteria bacterium 